MITLDKLTLAQMILSQDSLFVYLAARPENVVVPPWLKHQDELVLQFGTNMPIPITDLHVDNTGIYGTLSFHQTPFTCAVPWSAVWGLKGENTKLEFVWLEDRPERTVKMKKLPNGWAVIEGGKV